MSYWLLENKGNTILAFYGYQLPLMPLRRIWRGRSTTRSPKSRSCIVGLIFSPRVPRYLKHNMKASNLFCTLMSRCISTVECERTLPVSRTWSCLQASMFAIIGISTSSCRQTILLPPFYSITQPVPGLTPGYGRAVHHHYGRTSVVHFGVQGDRACLASLWVGGYSSYNSTNITKDVKTESYHHYVTIPFPV